MKPIWIVDDDRSIRWVLEKSLDRAGWPYRSFSDAREALQALDSDTPQVLISDVRMPGMDGLELLRLMRERHPRVPVIIMTAFSDLDSAVASFQSGAFDYLAKPFDVEEALQLIGRAMGRQQGAQSGHEQDREVGFQAGMLGQAPAMQELFRAIGRLSSSSATVLITGESGSGKELVARALHRHSPRADKPFIALNTAAIATELLESELFGHERGAFTGAHVRRVGRFEEADGGTLFLDEIGDMPPELQTRLLRVLGDGSFYRVGGTMPLRVNVRVIAATHQPLEQRVRQGSFREDLFHRLNVIRLRLPPLRERPEDIALLARHFLQVSARNLGVETKVLNPAALQVLERFSFPGNVRQLENVCHWLTVMAPSTVIDVRDLPPELREATSWSAAPFTPELRGSERELGGRDASHGESMRQDFRSDTRGDFRTDNRSSSGVGDHAGAVQGRSTAEDASSWTASLEHLALQRLRAGDTNILPELSQAFERTLIQAALTATGGRRVDAASRLGWGRNTITRKMRELGMD